MARRRCSMNALDAGGEGGSEMKWERGRVEGKEYLLVS